MSDTTILELTTASVVSETEDYIPMVDVSDTTESNDGTTKRATVRKLLKDKALPSGDIVGTSDEQTLENKTLTSPSITDADITGGSVSATTDVVEVLKKVYPVGCIYTSTVSTNPNTLFGFGTWSEYGQGRVLVGKSAEAEFDTAGKTGGAKTHTLTESELPNIKGWFQGRNTKAGRNILDSISSIPGRNVFSHDLSGGTKWSYSLADDTNSNTYNARIDLDFGSDEAHNNLQPYIVVYFWHRTA